MGSRIDEESFKAWMSRKGYIIPSPYVRGVFEREYERELMVDRNESFLPLKYIGIRFS